MPGYHKIGQKAWILQGKTKCGIRSPYSYLYATIMEQVGWAHWDAEKKLWLAPKTHIRQMLRIYKACHQTIILDTPITIKEA